MNELQRVREYSADGASQDSQPLCFRPEDRDREKEPGECVKADDGQIAQTVCRYAPIISRRGA